MITNWEHLLTHRLLKRAAVEWHGLDPLPKWDFFYSKMPDVTVAASLPQVLDATAENWVGQALEVADDLARMTGHPLSLPPDPEQRILRWLRPKKSPTGTRQIPTFVSVPVPKSNDFFPVADRFVTIDALKSKPYEVIQDWLENLRVELFDEPGHLLADLLYETLQSPGGATLNSPQLTERGIGPSHYRGGKTPVVHAHMFREFTPVVAHELGHASIPRFTLKVAPDRERILHPELSNISILHRIMPILVEGLRQRLGESPYTAQAVGRFLSTLISKHEGYLRQLRRESERRLLTTPPYLEKEHARYAMAQLLGLNQLQDPWGQAVLAHAIAAMTGQAPEDPHLRRVRANVQNFLAYLAASARNPKVRAGKLDFVQLLDSLAKMIAELQQQTADPQKAQMYRTAIEGPKSLDELATFLEEVKKQVPDVVKLIPYKTLHHMLHGPEKGARILQRTMQYPKLTESVVIK